MPKPPYNTTYNGLPVDADTARDLQNSPAAEFLSFEKNPDGNFTLQAKYPEMGRFDDKEFHIRENVNYFLRGVLQCCLDDKNRLDMKKTKNTYETVRDHIDRGAIPPGFREACGLPEERMQEFTLFTRVCRAPLHMMLFHFMNEALALQVFQYHIQKLEGKEMDPAAQFTRKYELLGASAPDYQNILNHYARMADMDPLKETAILTGSENYNFTGWFADFLVLNNSYRKARGLTENIGKRITVAVNTKDGPEPGRDAHLRQSEQSGFLLQGEVGGKKVHISLETRLAPKGKLLQCPEKARTGVGIYSSEEDFAAFHQRDPYVTISPDRLDTYQELLKSSGPALDPVQRISPDCDFLMDGPENLGAAHIVERISPAEERREEWLDYSQQPLFPQGSHPGDLASQVQGSDFLSKQLSTVARFAPHKIRDCITDNMDGTVTVRFFSRLPEEKAGDEPIFRPVFVTVDKKIPAKPGSKDCLWAQLIRRAYLASGLAMSASRYTQPIPPREALDDEFQILASLPPEKRPSHTLCPWLIDPCGNLHKWDPLYRNSASEIRSYFTDQLLGKVLQPVKSQEPLFTGDTVSHYGRALSAVLKSLDTTSRDSVAYKGLYSRLQSLVEKDGIARFHGDSFLEIKRNGDIYGLQTACDVYLQHCKENPRPLSLRRNNRIHQVKTMLKLLRALQQDFPDPKDSLARTLVDKMAEGSPKYADLSDLEKDQRVRNLVCRKEFRLWKESMSFDQMVRMTEQSPGRIRSSFASAIRDQQKTEEKAARQGAKAEEQTNLSAKGPKGPLPGM